MIIMKYPIIILKDSFVNFIVAICRNTLKSFLN